MQWTFPAMSASTLHSRIVWKWPSDRVSFRRFGSFPLPHIINVRKTIWNSVSDDDSMAKCNESSSRTIFVCERMPQAATKIEWKNGRNAEIQHGCDKCELKRECVRGKRVSGEERCVLEIKCGNWWVPLGRSVISLNFVWFTISTCAWSRNLRIRR